MKEYKKLKVHLKETFYVEYKGKPTFVDQILYNFDGPIDSSLFEIDNTVYIRIPPRNKILKDYDLPFFLPIKETLEEIKKFGQIDDNSLIAL